ncbi:heavy metal-binding domain-containing protein [Sphingobacterium anhuiense]|uniref:Heavy metal-binding domain-containing protein n=1 Tax=Sphingobacterium anhuiense TaxID=493780 RepID=A0ABW5YX62_9SPHI
MLYFRAFKTVFIIHHDRYQYQYHRGERSLRYFDPISATAVIGANALSEIGARFVDLFGGRSRNYENKLQALYKSVVESLKHNADSF